MPERNMSIMNYIQASVDDTMSLPSGFSLEPYRTSGDAALADGAQDGIYLYHTEPVKHDASALNACLTLIRKLSNCKEGTGAREIVDDFARKYRAIEVMDVIQKILSTYKSQFNSDNISMSALMTMMDTENIESVKYALMIFEVFQMGTVMEEIKPNIYLLGLSDEFTLYALSNMDRWKDGADWIAQTAVRVTGWGRIHAVRFINGVSRAEQDWLLSEGWKNDIMPQYSALQCLERSKIYDRMKDENGISAGEFASLQELMPWLLDEEPVAGLSAFPDRIDFLKRFLAAAKTYKGAADTKTIVDVLAYMARETGGTQGIRISEAIASAAAGCAPEACASCTANCTAAGGEKGAKDEGGAGTEGAAKM